MELHEHLKSLKVTNDKSTLEWQKYRDIKGDYQSLDHCGRDRSSYSAERKITKMFSMFGSIVQILDFWLCSLV